MRKQVVQREAVFRRRLRNSSAARKDSAWKLDPLAKEPPEPTQLPECSSDLEGSREERTLESRLERLAQELETMRSSQQEIKQHLSQLTAWLQQQAAETRKDITSLHAEFLQLQHPAGVEEESETPRVESEPLSAEEYREIVNRTCELVLRTLPSNSTILVTSKGDDQLVRFDGLKGEHFPQMPNGTYAGSYPANSQEAINHLEELRSRKTVHYLLLPRPAFWWLDHYDGFREHLEKNYREHLFEPDTCLIYDLNPADSETESHAHEETESRCEAGSQIEALVQALLPPRQTVTVLAARDTSFLQLGDRPLFWCRAQDGGDSLIERIEELRLQGSHFLIVPSQLSDWFEEQTSLKRHLYSHYRRVSHQRHVCTIFSLSPANRESHVSS